MKKLLLAIALVLAVTGAQAITTGVNVLSDTQLAIVVTGATSPAVEVLDFVLTFNPVLVATSVAEGEFIKKAGGSYMAFEDIQAGVVSYTVTRLGPAGSTGSGTGAVVTFEGGLNTTNVHYFVKLIDAESNDVIVAEGDTLQGPEPVVPEPMTLALVAAALAGLGVVARKRS